MSDPQPGEKPIPEPPLDRGASRRSLLSLWLPQLPALLTLIVGIYTYQQTTRHETLTLATNARKERQQPFLNKQLELYFEACQVSSRLASSRDPSTWHSAYKRFWELYWGDLGIVESPFEEEQQHSVEAHMVSIGNILLGTGGEVRHLTEEQRHAVLDPHQPEGPDNFDGLEQLSLQLARACRQDIRETWNFSTMLPKNEQ